MILADFFNMCQQIGSNPRFVHPGGGNCSVKLNSQWMLIKPSGVSMEKMHSLEDGCLLHYPKIVNAIQSPSWSHHDYDQLLQDSKKTGSRRPSMEAGFHALLGPVVLHTHSDYFNVFLCSEEGPKILQELFPAAVNIDFFLPGADLSYAVSQVDTSQNLYFLNNHGLIISVDTAQKALEMHQSIHDILLNAFDLLRGELKSGNSIRMPEKVYFPDQALFSNDESNNPLLSSISFIQQKQEILGLTPKFLLDTEVQAICSLESEKFRSKALHAIYSS